MLETSYLSFIHLQSRLLMVFIFAHYSTDKTVNYIDYPILYPEYQSHINSSAELAQMSGEAEMRKNGEESS